MGKAPNNIKLYEKTSHNFSCELSKSILRLLFKIFPVTEKVSKFIYQVLYGVCNYMERIGHTRKNVDAITETVLSTALIVCSLKRMQGMRMWLRSSYPSSESSPLKRSGLKGLIPSCSIPSNPSTLHKNRIVSINTSDIYLTSHSMGTSLSGIYITFFCQ